MYALVDWIATEGHSARTAVCTTRLTDLFRALVRGGFSVHGFATGGPRRSCGRRITTLLDRSDSTPREVRLPWVPATAFRISRLVDSICARTLIRSHLKNTVGCACAPIRGFKFHDAWDALYRSRNRVVFEMTLVKKLDVVF